MNLSSLVRGHWNLGLTLESIVVPVTFSFDAVLVDEAATALADSLMVKAFEDGAIWLNAAPVASSLPVPESSFVYSVVGEDHSSKALRLAELVDGASVDPFFVVYCLDLYRFGEEKFDTLILDGIQVA